MSKFITENIEQTLYDENGIKRSHTTKKKVSVKESEEHFYMVFLKCVGWMYNLKGGTTLQVLCKLLEFAEYGTGEISLSTGKRQEIMDQLNITKSTLTQSIKQLVASGALKSKTKIVKDENGVPIVKDGEIQKAPIRGEYMVNPSMFWKGSLKKRKNFKIIFESDYDTTGLTEKVPE